MWTLVSIMVVPYSFGIHSAIAYYDNATESRVHEPVMMIAYTHIVILHCSCANWGPIQKSDGFV